MSPLESDAMALGWESPRPTWYSVMYLDASGLDVATETTAGSASRELSVWPDVELRKYATEENVSNETRTTVMRTSVSSGA